MFLSSFFFNDTATTEIYTLSLHDALPISGQGERSERREGRREQRLDVGARRTGGPPGRGEAELQRPELRERARSEEHTSELQSRLHLVCRLLLEKKKKKKKK